MPWYIDIPMIYRYSCLELITRLFWYIKHCRRFSKLLTGSAMASLVASGVQLRDAKWKRITRKVVLEWGAVVIKTFSSLHMNSAATDWLQPVKANQILCFEYDINKGETHAFSKPSHGLHGRATIIILWFGLGDDNYQIFSRSPLVWELYGRVLLGGDGNGGCKQRH